MKRTNYLLLLVAVLVMGKLSWAQAEWPKTWISGGTTCTLTENGIFTVGVAVGQNGVMADYDQETSRPWQGHLSNITKLNVENGVKVIGKQAFLSCHLTEVTLPEGLLDIHYGAFWYCDNLPSITIPRTVTHVAAEAFHACNALNDVYCYPYPENLTWESSSYDFIQSQESVWPRTTQMHVYALQLADYQSKFGESLNVSIVGIDPTGNWTDEGNYTTPAVNGHVITINSEAELAAIAYHANANDSYANAYFTTSYTIILNKDLDFSAHYWVPIGIDGDHKCEAQFNGNGHTIRGLIVNRPDQDYNGLYGYLGDRAEVVIQNFVLKNSTITGRDYTGSVVGYMYERATLSNVVSYACVSGGSHVGGLAGKAEYNAIGYTPDQMYIPKIENCLYLNGQVSGTGNHAYIVGTKDSFTEISNTYYCHATTSGNNTDVRAYRFKKGDDVPSSVSIAFAATNGISHESCLYAPNNETVTITATCNDISKRITNVLVNGVYATGSSGSYTYTVNASSATEYVVTVTLDDEELLGFVFQTDGYWNVASNWRNYNIPTIDDIGEVAIIANAIIPSNYVAYADEIVLNPGNTITIENGGQLVHTNADVNATVKRTINTYTGTKDNYYLIASPMANAVNITNQANLVANHYDLYRFDQTGDAEGREWINFKSNSEGFNIVNRTGYLYANSGDGEATTYTIELNGQLKPSYHDVQVDLVYNDNVNFKGWNLVGNPFACNAYIGQDFYRLGNGAVDATPASGAIAPMEGVFVKATATGQSVTFSRNAPQNSNGDAVLNVIVTQQDGLVDMARVRFNGNSSLEKFQLNPSHTKVYIPQDGKDYAVAVIASDSEAIQTEIPVNFEASENGTYTLSFSLENMDVDYLHLIDNLTGADIDLLTPAGFPLYKGGQGDSNNPQTASYTFTAKTTDFPSRFRLVFSVCGDANDNNETFAFISNGNIIVDGEGLLQVVDVMGRAVVSVGGRTRCVPTSGMTPGIYVLRLINGDDVKTQKIVIR